MKRLGLLAALAACVALAVPATAPAQSSKNIVQTAQGAGNFKTLVSLVKKAGLAKTLSGRAKYTVFAPTDAAFAKVPKKTLDALGKNKAALKQVLLYHVVEGSVPASKVVTLKSATTVEAPRSRSRSAAATSSSTARPRSPRRTSARPTASCTSSTRS